MADTTDNSVIGFYNRADRSWDTQRQQVFLRRAAAVAQQIVETGTLPGQYVIIACTSPEATLLSFVGSVMVGAIPTVLPIRTAFDSREAIIGRIDDTLRLLGGDSLIILEEKAGKPVVPLADKQAVLRLDAATVGQLADAAQLPDVEIPEISHIQLTSGSTGANKGVAVTHANVLANVAAIELRSSVNHKDVWVSWLPLYHDMGLVGQALTTLIFGIDLYLMSPFDFVSNPFLWVQTISEKRATVAASPNFGYGLVADKVTDEQLTTLDLSSWKMAGCGAEPISTRVVRAFYERFTPCGLSPTTLTPCYGLAEATLAVTSNKRQELWRSITVSRSSLSGLGAVEQVPAGDFNNDAIEVVSLGTAVEGLEVSLVDMDGNVIEDELVCGEIVVSGTSVTAGWIEEGNKLSPFPGDGLHTGDIGFFESDELFVVERIKNIIIRNGQNHSSQVMEQALADLAGIDASDVLVLDRDLTEGTGLTGLVEIDKKTHPSNYFEAIKKGLDCLDLPLESLVFVKRGSLPRTTSGKKRHVAAREALNAGTLTVLAEHDVRTLPGPTPIDENTIDLTVQYLADDLTLDQNEEEMCLLNVVTNHVRDRGLDVPVTMVARLQHDLDFDSLGLLNLSSHIEEIFDIEFARETVAEISTMDDLLQAVRSAKTRSMASGILDLKTEAMRVIAVDENTYLAKAKQLHAKVYHQLGYVKNSDLVENGKSIGQEEDPYQDHAQYFVTERMNLEKPAVVASARLIVADPEKGHCSFQTYLDQPIHDQYRSEIEQMDPSSCAEISALVKAPGESSLAVWMLYRAMWNFSLQKGHKTWLMSCDVDLLETIQPLFGSALKIIGDQAFFKGHNVVPLMIDVENFYKILSQPSPQSSLVDQQLHSMLVNFLFGEFGEGDGEQLHSNTSEELIRQT